MIIITIRTNENFEYENANFQSLIKISVILLRYSARWKVRMQLNILIHAWWNAIAYILSINSITKNKTRFYFFESSQWCMQIYKCLKGTYHGYTLVYFVVPDRIWIIVLGLWQRTDYGVTRNIKFWTIFVFFTKSLNIPSLLFLSA